MLWIKEATGTLRASPTVDLVVSEAPPPGHDAKYEDDTRRKQCNPADEDARHSAEPRVVCYDSTCVGRII